MADSLPADVAGVVLAAGAGERLKPLSCVRPKALCPVGNVSLVDLALARVVGAIGDPSAVAVNVHHGRPQMEAHFEATSVHLSIEIDEALGTAGALGHLRPWLDGRAALVVNADAWCGADLGAFVDEWDRTRVRVMVHGDEPFGPRSRIVASLMPSSAIASFESVPSGLYERCWRGAAERGDLETVPYDGRFVDCGTPGQYLEANLLAAELAAPRGLAAPPTLVHPTAIVDARAVVEHSVVGEGAVVAGHVVDSVVWDGGHVGAHESLRRAVRTDNGVTVLIR